ncbi:MAG: 50S ribosomal protein L21 [Ectothiorhodospiraceae bacterium]|nr:50S ribosomal protein L21 [Ectothiorhodospiraceae bacterium]
MYAIVNIAGKQFKVTEEQKLFVPLLDQEVGSTVEFPNVMLYSNGEKVEIGTPTLDAHKVTATVLDHIKDEKVLVIKKKRRKGYRKLNGHRQQYTQIEVKSIEAA